MKKYSFIFLLSFLLFGNLFAQQDVFKTQGIPRPDLEVKSQKKSKLKSSGKEIPNFSFDEIKFWVGEGENKAALIVDWYYDGSPTLVWGFRWDGDATGEQMVRAIAAEDSRFAASIEGWGWANTLSGLGYDANDNNNGTFCATDGTTTLCIDGTGVMGATGDGYNPVDASDYWRSGWYDGYWSYQLREVDATEYEYSNVGFTDRHLVNGCWDAWAYQVGWDSWEGVIPRLPYIVASAMTLDNTTATVNAGASIELTPKVYQKSYVGRTIVWSSSDTSIATVDQNGKVTGKKAGSVTITAKIADECFANCEVTINPSDKGFTSEDVEFWIGEGAKETILAIDWHDGKNPDALVWGYRWDGDKTAFEMLEDIFQYDSRLYTLVRKATADDQTRSIVGFGYDINGKNSLAILQGGNTIYPMYAVKGLITVTLADAALNTLDTYTGLDMEDHWESGWNTGKWSFWEKDKTASDFVYSDKLPTEYLLEDGKWIGWSFNSTPEQANATPLSANLTPASIYVQEIIDYTKGIFFVNEDWFTHINSSLNFLTEDDRMIYRAYTRENYGQAFGATAQFGAIYGDNFYFVSKQAADGGDTQYTPGGRLVVADAKTLKKKAGFDDIGGGDGRSFLGVDENTGYIGTSNGIQILNLDDLTLGDKVKGAENEGGGLYNGQVGTMLRIGNYVFAAVQNKGVMVIDPVKHQVLQIIECKNIGTIVQSKDGYLWATAYSDGLWKIDPYKLEIVEKRAIPEAAWIPSSWGAWTSSLICASEKTNTLFWAKMNGSTMTFFGKKVYKYDIDNPNLSKPFYELTQDKEAFYGSAINIDPITENLVITTTQEGYSENYSYNWIHIVDSNTGQLIKRHTLDKHYWFPAMSVFPDNFVPEISDQLSNLNIEEKTTYSLLDNVTDKDSKNGAIVSTISGGGDIVRPIIMNDEIQLQPLKAGTTTVTLKSNSNGKTVEKVIDVNVAFTSVESIDFDNKIEILEARDTLTLIPVFYPVIASNKTVFWTSSDESVAKVDKNGLVTTYNVTVDTDVVITAKTEDGEKQAQCTITVKNVPVEGVTFENKNQKVKLKGTLQLSPLFVPVNATNQNVTWESLDPSIATIDEFGIVTGVSLGRATIKVTTEEGNYTEMCEVHVYTAVTSVSLNTTTLRIEKDNTYQLVATVNPSGADYKNVIWTSSNEDVATVDQNGLVTTKEYGTATITVTTEDQGKTRTCAITVLKPVTSITLDRSETKLGIGHTLQLNAVLNPTDATSKTITWTTSSTAIATVSNGLVTAKTAGTVTITATVPAASILTGQTTLKTTCVITVGTPVSNIELDQEAEVKLAEGETLVLTAAISPTDAINKNVLWTSSDENVVVLEAVQRNEGLRSQSITAESVTMKAVGYGSSTITATSEDGSYTSSCEISVNLSTGLEFVSDQRTSYFVDGQLILKNYEGYTFNVYSLTGSPVMQFVVNSNDLVKEMNLSKGIYIIKAQKENKSAVIKISID